MDDELTQINLALDGDKITINVIFIGFNGKKEEYELECKCERNGYIQNNYHGDDECKKYI